MNFEQNIQALKEDKIVTSITILSLVITSSFFFTARPGITSPGYNILGLCRVLVQVWAAALPST